LKTIIIGSGYPAFSDDGVGSLIAQAIMAGIWFTYIKVVGVLGGLNPLDIIANHEKSTIGVLCPPNPSKRLPPLLTKGGKGGCYA
jgi:Ni,Fe-hydrogenase maturation factor